MDEATLAEMDRITEEMRRAGLIVTRIDIRAVGPRPLRIDMDVEAVAEVADNAREKVMRSCLGPRWDLTRADRISEGMKAPRVSFSAFRVAAGDRPA